MAAGWESQREGANIHTDYARGNRLATPQKVRMLFSCHYADENFYVRRGNAA